MSEVQEESHPDQPTVQSSTEEVWYLKPITFTTKRGSRNLKIITQNYNGPCSLIAICNILILRGSIKILPKARETVSYEFLSQLVGEHLLKTNPDADIAAALSVLPLTQQGMDLNPLFINPMSFRPHGNGGELTLFQQARIPLVHGWLVDPASPEAAAVAKTKDYDSSVNLVAEADHITSGTLVIDEDENENPFEPGPSSAGGSSSQPQAGSSSSAGPSWDKGKSKDNTDVIEDAIHIRRFLETTRSQLTYHGLFEVAATLQRGSLVALFRNMHLSVLHKPESEDAIYTLVTDYIFANEPSIVWEKLQDVTGEQASFVDSNFIESNPPGGNFVAGGFSPGQTAEQAMRAYEASQFAASHPGDMQLAFQLQDEENRKAAWSRQQARLARERREMNEVQLLAKKQKDAEKAVARKARRQEMQKNCVVM